MQPNKTFIIQHKQTKKQIKGRKSSWKAVAHAKSAFANMRWYSFDKEAFKLPNDWPYYLKFDQQDVFEIVEVKSKEQDNYERAISLLKDCLGRCEWYLQQEIERFLEEVGSGK